MKWLILFSIFSLNLNAKTFTVEMSLNRFIPQNLTIKRGDTVTFVNKTNVVHNVVSPEFQLRSKYMRKGDKYSITFKDEMQVKYYCELHKNMGMEGTIEVI